MNLNPQTVAQQLPALLTRRKLDPSVISEYILARGRFQETWLIAVLDTQRMSKLEHYTAPDLLHHLSTNLGGATVLPSNSSGLRYGILISGRPSLPANIELPAGAADGQFHLGQNIRAERIAIPSFDALGHVTVAGMTGSGKSNFVRLLLNQAVAAGAALLLVDPDEQSFGEYEDHPALLAPIANLSAAEKVVNRAILEKYSRSQAYKTLRSSLRLPRVENLDEYNKLAVTTAASRPMPRLLVVVDEVSTLILRSGGPRSDLAANLFELVNGGRKFGIHVVMAGQDFRRETTGALISQSRTVVCFQVKEPSTSRVVLGAEGAELLRTPGRALTNAWGLIQTYAAPQISFMPEDRPAYSPVTPDQVAAAARTEIEEMADRILAENALSWSKRRIASQLFNRAYAGAYCVKLDQALEIASAIASATTTSPAEAFTIPATAASSGL